MFSLSLKLTRAADWGGWLPLAALPLFMFAALLALGGDRWHFYRGGYIYNWDTTRMLAISEHLSPEHNFRLTHYIRRGEDGGFRYSHYGRFPIGGYALLNLTMLPFGNDLAAKLAAARVLMLLMFCGAATFAFLAMSRITGSRRVAFAAALLAFSGYYAVYYADEVSNESVMDLFGAALVFHGMVLFVQEGRFRQLLVKTCAALLLGWHVYALLLPFIALGFGGEAVALLRSARASGGRAGAVARARSAIVALARSRYAALAAVAILFGSALLAFNFANEYSAHAGERALSETSSFSSMIRRFGLTENHDDRPELAWGNFTMRQLYRVGAASAPYAVVRAVGYDIPAREPLNPALAPAVLGAAATAAALALAAFARRYRILPATAVLFGFCWAIPMRHNTFWPEHDFEGIPYLWLTLALFALALTLALRRLGKRLGERVVLGVGAAAALAFALSVFYVGQFDRYPGEAERNKAIMADFSAIRGIARGKTVEFVPYQRNSWSDARYPFSRVRMNLHYYTSGSYKIPGDFADACDTRGADFAISRYRDESLNLLTPENRFAFLYEGLSPTELCRAERRALEATEPAARGAFDVYLQDDSVSYLKAPCEARDYEAPFFLYAYTARSDGLSASEGLHGFVSVDPKTEGLRPYRVADFDGACLLTVYLPDYPIAAIRTGQWLPGVERLWEVSISPPLGAEALAFYEKAWQAVASSGEPAARSGFDLYLDGDTLYYLKEPCGEEDTRGRFFLSVHPVDVADLPEERREIGHDSLNFTFAPPAGAVFGGKCMAARQLPDYGIARIETGQWIPGGERLWDAEMVVSD